MHTYELLMILPAGKTEQERIELLGRAKEILAANSAQAGEEQALGVFKFAYPLRKERHGAYYMLRFDSEPEKVNAVRAAISLSGITLRFSIERTDAKSTGRRYAITEYEVPNRERKLRRVVRRKASAPAGRMILPRPAASAIAEQPETKPQAAKPQMSEEEIEAQIDKILEEKII